MNVKMNNTKYIAFEGIDGSGKSTQVEMLCKALIGLNYTPIHLVEPTHGGFGAKVREMISNNVVRNPQEEKRLFTMDRQEHIKRKISPVLEMMRKTEPHCGFKIIQERSFYSSPAYQFTDENLILHEIGRQKEFAPMYDIVLVIDVPVEVADERLQDRTDKREMFEDRETLNQVRRNYQFISRIEEAIIVIDGEGSQEKVHDRIIERLGFPRFDPLIEGAEDE